MRGVEAEIEARASKGRNEPEIKEDRADQRRVTPRGLLRCPRLVHI